MCRAGMPPGNIFVKNPPDGAADGWGRCKREAFPERLFGFAQEDKAAGNEHCEKQGLVTKQRHCREQNAERNGQGLPQWKRSEQQAEHCQKTEWWRAGMCTRTPTSPPCRPMEKPRNPMPATGQEAANPESCPQDGQEKNGGDAVRCDGEDARQQRIRERGQAARFVSQDAPDAVFPKIERDAA